MIAIELIREDNFPLFYILMEDKEIKIKRFDGMPDRIEIIKKGDVVPNYYKSNCHLIEKRGKSKGRLMGLHKEYVGFTTLTELPVNMLDAISKSIPQFQQLHKLFAFLPNS